MADVLLEILTIPDIHVAKAKEGLEYLSWESLSQSDRPETPAALTAFELKALEKQMHKEWLLGSIRGALYRKSEAADKLATQTEIEGIDLS